MPVSSPPSPLQADPRIRNQGHDGLPEGSRSTENMTANNIKSEKDLLKPFTESWSLGQIEEFFVGHGFKDEVDYVKSAELQDDKLDKLNAGLAISTPLENFTLKMGLRVLELIKALRKLESSSGSSGVAGAGTSWGGGGSSFGSTSYTGGGDFGSGGGRAGGGGGNSSFDFGGRGGGGGGGGQKCYNCQQEGHMSRECPEPKKFGAGRGGPQKCFNCQQEGHMSRECPEPKQFGGGRGGGGGNRACFKCGQEGHMSRECPQGGGGGGYNSGGGDSSFSSFKRGNDGGDSGPSFKRPRQSEGWNSAPAAPAPAEDSWD